MSSGLFALLDDVAAIAKTAAASVDDIAATTMKAGAKSAGIVIDDAAVTPKYVVGFAADREIPIVWNIMMGSLKNKMLFLLPAALFLSYFLPFLITPLLMLGGAYLCFEGAEKIIEKMSSNKNNENKSAQLKNEKDTVKGAIRTDFILSAEIMAMTLSTVADKSLAMQISVLAVVGLFITFIVYGAVAVIVKADDYGIYLARKERAKFANAIGHALVAGMPKFLSVLTVVGTAAMLWVGGGIIIHGLAHFDLTGIEHAIHVVSDAVKSSMPFASGLFSWLVSAALAGILGFILGSLIAGIMHFVPTNKNHD